VASSFEEDGGLSHGNFDVRVWLDDTIVENDSYS
jgi:hypothetical protein